MRKYKLIILSGVCSLVWNTMFSQITISEQIQPSKIVTQESNKLYFVDFWATWCAPCIHAKKYLTAVQKQFPKDFYIISITVEAPETVKKFLAKRPSELAIAIDYDKETFTKHGIKSLPSGILFNAEGEKIWEGHPADLKVSHLRRFLDKHANRITIDEFVRLKEYEKEAVQNVSSGPEDDLELIQSERNSGILRINKQDSFTSYEGSLKSILAFLLKVSDQQIHLSENIGNRYYKLNIIHGSREHKKLVKSVLKKLKLKLEENSEVGDVLTMQIENPKFWDTSQIDWGINNPKYLIDDSQIQADNVSFEDVKYRLSNLLEIPVIVSDHGNGSLHDWQVHYKFYELMQTDLSENFGIEIEKKRTDYPIYMIRKKTP